MDVFRAYKNIQTVHNQFDDIVQSVISANQAELIDLNTSQLEQGKTSESKFITPEYRSDDYAQFKQSQGSKAPFGTPDLKLTGDFYSGFKAEVAPKYLEITSTDKKSGKLQKKYGDEIYGLTDKNKSEFAQLIKEPLLKNVRDGFKK